MMQPKSVIFVNHDEVVALVESVLSRRGVEFDDFVDQGEADQLDDDELRDLWLAVGPAIPRDAA